MTDTATTEAEAVKKTVTKRDVTALLESFKPEAKVESAAEKQRANRLKAWNTAVAGLAGMFDSLGAIDGPANDAAATLRALSTVQKKGAATITGISDAKLTGEVAPKAARQPRPSTARILSAEDAKAAAERNARLDEKAAEPEDEKPVAEEETTEEMDARIKAEREARAEEGAPAAPTQHRSGPPRSGPIAPTSTTQGDPRGDEDPNNGDGF